MISKHLTDTICFIKIERRIQYGKYNVILSAADAYFGKDRCDVEFGPHFLDGDLKTYHIHVDRTGGVNGTDGSGGQGEASDVGCDLILTSTAKPWRPGAGGFAFDEDGYFTWLCAVPRGTVTGTLFYDGQQIIERSGDMIYEFVYMGTTVKEKMENF